MDYDSLVVFSSEEKDRIASITELLNTSELPLPVLLTIELQNQTLYVWDSLIFGHYRPHHSPTLLEEPDLTRLSFPHETLHVDQHALTCLLLGDPTLVFSRAERPHLVDYYALLHLLRLPSHCLAFLGEMERDASNLDTPLLIALLYLGFKRFECDKILARDPDDLLRELDDQRAEVASRDNRFAAFLRRRSEANSTDDTDDPLDPCSNAFNLCLLNLLNAPTRQTEFEDRTNVRICEQLGLLDRVTRHQIEDFRTHSDFFVVDKPIKDNCKVFRQLMAVQLHRLWKTGKAANLLIEIEITPNIPTSQHVRTQPTNTINENDISEEMEEEGERDEINLLPSTLPPLITIDSLPGIISPSSSTELLDVHLEILLWKSKFFSDIFSKKKEIYLKSGRLNLSNQIKYESLAALIEHAYHGCIQTRCSFGVLVEMWRIAERYQEESIIDIRKMLREKSQSLMQENQLETAIISAAEYLDVYVIQDAMRIFPNTWGQLDRKNLIRRVTQALLKREALSKLDSVMSRIKSHQAQLDLWREEGNHEKMDQILAWFETVRVRSDKVRELVVKSVEKPPEEIVDDPREIAAATTTPILFPSRSAQEALLVAGTRARPDLLTAPPPPVTRSHGLRPAVRRSQARATDFRDQALFDGPRPLPPAPPRRQRPNPFREAMMRRRRDFQTQPPAPPPPPPPPAPPRRTPRMRPRRSRSPPARTPADRARAGGSLMSRLSELIRQRREEMLQRDANANAASLGFTTRRVDHGTDDDDDDDDESWSDAAEDDDW